MKRFAITMLVAIALALPTTTNAQAFEQGKSQVSAGYGVGNFVQALFQVYEDYDAWESTPMGPFFLKYEFGATEKIGFGVNIAYAGVNGKYNVTDDFNNETTEETIKWSSISVLARMNYHFGTHDKFDPYWGVGMGYRTGNWQFSEAGVEASNTLFPFGFETTFGSRYMFTPFLGAYAELGISKAIFQFGLNAKF